MPNLFSSLRECLGFSQIIKSTMLKVSSARKLKSPRFPIGVEIIYNPLCKTLILFLFIFIVSCVPANYSNKNILVKNYPETKEIEEIKISKKNKINGESNKQKNFLDDKIISQIEIILPNIKNKRITNHITNSFELSVYIKKIDNLNLTINEYYDSKDLNTIISNKSSPGKIFIGTLSSLDSKIIKKYCNKGILFFSFTSDKNVAGDCVYLINFFPDDDLNALFDFFPEESKIALLYPENYYGYSINNIIDNIALKSNSIIINRASYKEDLSNAREAIKELSKYELRKYELERQKKILQTKDDKKSKNLLKKIQKFETTDDVDFTHIILPDYSIRLLEIAPLLPFYDVDPNKVQFVGTGVWDDEIFFDEPTLQNAIFSGIEKENRIKFFEDYFYVHKEKPIRTATIPYDLVGILSYILNKQMSLKDAYNFLDNEKIKFDGIDGKFYFNKNIISRELNILKINNGLAKRLN